MCDICVRLPEADRRGDEGKREEMQRTIIIIMYIPTCCLTQLNCHTCLSPFYVLLSFCRNLSSQLSRLVNIHLTTTDCFVVIYTSFS